MTRARDASLELARMLAALLWVVATSAIVIAAVGALPGWLAGEPRSVHRVASIEEAERRLGGRVLLPSVFPERLAWPAADVRIAGGRGGSVALTFTDHAGVPALQLLVPAEDGASIAAQLLEDRTVLSTQRTRVGNRPATLSSVLVAGSPWQELAWELQGRPILLRTRGDLDELYRMARSTHGEGRP